MAEDSPGNGPVIAAHHDKEPVPNSEAVDAIYASLGALPDPDYGVINLLPWAHESDETNAVKRRVCEGIVRVFENAGYSFDRERDESEPSRNISILCRSCGKLLLRTNVDNRGIANVPGVTIISGMAAISDQCPHTPVTIDDQRRLIEQAVLAAQE